MKSKKLSNAEREELVDSLVKSAFKKQDVKLSNMRCHFAESVYKKFVSPHQKALKLLEEIATYKSHGCGAKSNQYHRWVRGTMKEARLFLKGHDFIPRLDAKEHKELNDRMQKIFQAEDKLKEEKSIAESKTRAALNSVGSTKQLSDIWPEAYVLYEKMFPPSEPMLPDVRRNDLNKLLNLKEIKE